MLDTNKPTDQEFVSALPAYIRETRVAVNAVSGAGNVGVTELTVAAGATSLSIGTDLGAYGFETVVIDGAAAISLQRILGGTQGQVKVIIFQDNNVSLVDGAAANGNFYLNQLPALSTFAAQQNDVIALVNIGGDGASIQGYWKELYRTLAIK